MLRRCATALARWGSNPADIKFSSVSRRDGAALLEHHRKKTEYEKLKDDTVQRLALSIGSPEYIKNTDKADETLVRNPKTGEVGGYPGLDPTRYGDWEKGGRCIDF
eukprot:Hpha_TRINITY_DN3278_c0_g1::TRINITY_DN3278_c0_g1_i1::g.185952::m.185952